MNVSSRICRFELLQLLVDLRRVDLLRAGEIGADLDALPLFHVVGDHLADHPVRERVVGGLDPQVVEEVGVPEAIEVFADRLLDRLVVGHPVALRRRARLELDVIQVGLGLDDRLVALGLPAREDQVDDRPRSGRRQRRGRRDSHDSWRQDRRGRGRHCRRGRRRRLRAQQARRQTSGRQSDKSRKNLHIRTL